jgi:hypothetical protein
LTSLRRQPGVLVGAELWKIARQYGKDYQI